ncbi:hypothetical protein IB260_00555 [Pseudomonas sp. PDM23]|uniref:hypothetical protein n=1 Tax=unclassified Pseudomonas TaxID=196821 RepID=UPI00177AE4A6|nr:MULTISPECIES: hypothetical protein [unclassified Pseudomonas]MBD9573784.1 hypothetical protein [Pseudomonas sp. PDM23]MBD9671622.1 hypothetical protein [Pseudomonas sp. PDM21]
MSKPVTGCERFKTWVPQTIGGSMLAEAVPAERYENLEAEAQALREEVAALRARVVVLPSVDSVMNIVMRYQWNEKTNVTGTTNWAANLGMKVVDEVKRLNGKVVSEGVLRETMRHLGNWLELHECECESGFHYCGREQVAKTHRELRALLGEGKEVGDVPSA